MSLLIKINRKGNKEFSLSSISLHPSQPTYTGHFLHHNRTTPVANLHKQTTCITDTLNNPSQFVPQIQLALIHHSFPAHSHSPSSSMKRNNPSNTMGEAERIWKRRIQKKRKKKRTKNFIEKEGEQKSCRRPTHKAERSSIHHHWSLPSIPFQVIATVCRHTKLNPIRRPSQPLACTHNWQNLGCSHRSPNSPSSEDDPPYPTKEAPPAAIPTTVRSPCTRLIPSPHCHANHLHGYRYVYHDCRCRKMIPTYLDSL